MSFVDYQNKSSSLSSSLSGNAIAQTQIPSNCGATVSLKLKAPTWTQKQLKEAIQAVVTQQMRFTQASVHYGIPKGTLYDNILGKTKRMQALEEAGLTTEEETAVLEFCCQISASPYNRRTHKTLPEVLTFIQSLRLNRDSSFEFTGISGFRWWWAFCKKHSIVSLHYSGSTGGMTLATSAPGNSSSGHSNLKISSSLDQNYDEPYDFSTRDSQKHTISFSPTAAAVENKNQNSQNFFSGCSSWQEYLKLSVKSSLTSFSNTSSSNANNFPSIQEMHAKTSPICH